MSLYKEERTHRDTHRVEGHTKTEAELGTTQLQSMKDHGLLGATRTREDSSLEPLEGAWSNNILILDF